VRRGLAFFDYHGKVGFGGALLINLYRTSCRAVCNWRDGLSEVQRFGIVPAISLAICVLEFVGGFHSGSVSLLGDAVHVLGDTAVSILGFMTVVIAAAARTSEEGVRKRAFGALLSGALLVALTCVIFAMALLHLVQEGSHHMSGGEALTVALIGLAGNGVCLFLYSHGDVLVESVRWHVMLDILSSCIAIVSAILVKFTGVTFWDPVLSFAIVIILARVSYRVIRSAWRTVTLPSMEQSSAGHDGHGHA